MNRWAARFLGVILLLVFGLVFFNLYNQLQRMQGMQKPVETQTR